MSTQKEVAAQTGAATEAKAVAPVDLPSPEGKVKCANCEGTGKVFSSANLDTGEITYRPCHVCGGTGWVTAEMKHWSTDVSVSLNIARQLVSEQGRPAEVILESVPSEHHSVQVRMLFDDGCGCLLGGYAAGYSGTRPDYLRKRLLVAGFDVSSDDIENMERKSFPVRFAKGEGSRQ